MDERWQRLIAWMRGENVAYDLSSYEKVTNRICEEVTELKNLSDQEIRNRALRLRQGCAGEKLSILDEILVDTYALVFEAGRRTLGLSAFQEQLIGAVALHQKKIAEMQTGEGKTLMAVFPAVLGAFAGRGVHVLVPNDYLARRDAQWMGPIYRFLGLNVGAISGELDRKGRKKAYQASVTYATATEVGFDFLRDSLAMSPSELIQRPLFFGIFDDIDSTLIDEARTPLVVAGDEAPETSDSLGLAEIIRNLGPDKDYSTDEHGQSVFLTEAGAEKIEQTLGCDNLFTQESVELLTRVNLALHAEVLVKKDVDYLIRDGKIRMIDEHRGRVAIGRIWPHGLQGALEDKEGLKRTPSTKVLATTTLQSLARLYPRRAGMTATAFRVAPEFGALYGLEVVFIPPHKPCLREDLPDLVFTHNEARDRALIEEIREAHDEQRPVLVGTESVEASEALAKKLTEAGITPQVLNAKNDELEAEIIGQAGELGAVTISTNMAGRGTDIRLGGLDEKNRVEVAGKGGLCVLGRGRNESVRIDSQLRGRAGRQGDPGSSQFFVSLDDDLIDRYGVKRLLPTVYQDGQSDGPIDDPGVNREIERAQRIIAGKNASIRKALWSSESYVEKQRRVLSQRRREMLQGKTPSLLAQVSPEKYEAEFQRIGEKALFLAEQQISLAWIDRAWSNHLRRLEDLRESLRLIAIGVSVGSRIGRRNPLDVFRREARDSFEELEFEIDEGIVSSFEKAQLTEQGVDLPSLGFNPKTKLRTYLLKEQPIETRPNLRMVPTLLRSALNWFSKKGSTTRKSV